MRRFRVVFGKGEAVRYISHLDLMRTWERTLRRASINLAHTQGFNPRPRLIFAAPLPVGVTSDAEIVDVLIEDDLDARAFQTQITPSLPPGIDLREITEIEHNAPPVMAAVVSADYAVELDGAGDPAVIEAFLAKDTVPYERTRKSATKTADMRPSVLDLRLSGDQLFMRLRLDLEGAAVRPDEVLTALGLMGLRVHRTALHLKTEVAHAAA